MSILEGINAVNKIPLNELKTLMTAEYGSRTEIQKRKKELWNLSIKGDDIDGYTNHFHELAVMCPTLVTPEYKRLSLINRFDLKQRESAKATREGWKTNKEITTTATTPNNISKIEGKKLPRPIWLPSRGKGLSMELIAVQPMCAEKGNYRNKCLKRKDEQNEGARRRAYVMGMEEP
ncbi:hypothetical protein Tco_0386004 [Tanacetum coccineum]